MITYVYFIRMAGV